MSEQHCTEKCLLHVRWQVFSYHFRKKKRNFFSYLGEFYFEGLNVSVCTDVSVQVVALGSLNVKKYLENLANQFNNDKKYEYFSGG